MNSCSNNNFIQGLEGRRIDNFDLRGRRDWDDDCDCGSKRRRRHSDHPEGGPSILRVSTSGGTAFPVAVAALTVPSSVVGTTIDTCGLCNPSLLITFSTVITAVAAGPITFQLERVCGNNALPVSIGSFTVTLTVGTAPVSFTFAESCVQSCECECCCTYRIVIPVGVAIPGATTIAPATLAVLAVGQDEDKCCH